jgi:hypothetical protein
VRLLIAEVSLLFVGLCLPVASQQSVSPVAHSEAKDMVPAFDSSGAITLPAARLKIEIAYPHGKREQRSELTVLYDPKTGYYLWNVTNPNPNNPDDIGVRLKIMKAQGAVEFVDTAGLIQFEFGDGLFVKAWRGRADSLDVAVSASTSEIRQGIATFEGVGFHRDYKFVPIFGPMIGFDAKIPPGYKPISREFRCEAFNAFCPSDKNTIASISKQGSNWRLLLRNRFDVEVILDQNFDLVSAQQLTQPKPQNIDPLGLFK